MRHVVVSLCAFALLFAPGRARADEQRRTRLLVDSDGMLRVDPVYFELAKKTGGEMYFWADGEFVARAADVRARGPRGKGRTIAARYGDVPVEGTVEMEVEVPADSELGTVRFFAAIQKKESVTVTRPDGRIMDVSDERVAWADTRFMAFVTVSDPQPGTWKIAIAGQGLFHATGANVQEADELRRPVLPIHARSHGPRPSGAVSSERSSARGESGDLLR
jgi:hypothetical protein